MGKNNRNSDSDPELDIDLHEGKIDECASYTIFQDRTLLEIDIHDNNILNYPKGFKCTFVDGNGIMIHYKRKGGGKLALTYGLRLRISGSFNRNVNNINHFFWSNKNRAKVTIRIKKTPKQVWDLKAGTEWDRMEIVMTPDINCFSNLTNDPKPIPRFTTRTYPRGIIKNPLEVSGKNSPRKSIQFSDIIHRTNLGNDGRTKNSHKSLRKEASKYEALARKFAEVDIA